MAREGYTSGKPAVGWWQSEIKAGIDYRKRYAREDMWPAWRQYYRGRWADGVLPINLFFMMLRTTVPRLYFRNPSVSVMSAKPGRENLAFSLILQRIDNKLVRSMKIKKQMKKIVQDTFLFGTGAGKVGFGAEFSPAPGDEEGVKVEGGTLNWRPEYRADIVPNMPWFLRIPTGGLIVPPGVQDMDEARWVGHQMSRPLEDVMGDSRFTNTNSLQPTKIQTAGGTIQSQVQMVDLVEIRDTQTGKVFVIPKEAGDKPLLFEDDPLQHNGRTAIHSISFNDDDEVFWGVPDSVILDPRQREANEIRTQMMKHRRIAIAKILYEEGSIDKAEFDKLVSEDVGAGVKVNDISRVKFDQIAEIPRDLIVAGDSNTQDLREEMGFSRNQFGEYNNRSGDTTATEATIVRMATEIRVDERRDMLADMLTEIIRDTHNIIFSRWTQEQVIDLIGPGGVPLFVKYRGDMLRGGQYEVRVDPDSSVPMTKAVREQKANATFDRLKSNPLIDPIGLTEYLLHEMHGVEFDHLMVALNLQGGGTEDKPITPQEYAQILGKAGEQNQGLQQSLAGRPA